ncbi:replication protein A 70 kDa DNA-binding subunit B [Tanacetum coccineum]
MDEHNTKLQASVRPGLVNQFKNRLEEGKAVTLQRYSLGEIQPKYRMINKALRLSFLSNTDVEVCNDFTGSLYGFDFRSYRSITDLKQEEDSQFDVIGHVVACEELDNYDKNGKICVQNGYNGTKLFTFNCTVPIVDESFIDVKEYSERVFANQDVAESENTASRISTASKNSTKESFVSKIPPKNIAELLDVAQGVTSVIVGTIIAIHEEEGWWYIGCKVCKKKVIRSSNMVDLEAEMPKKKIDVKDDWYCTKCNVVPNIKTMFRLQIRVQDETGTMSLTLWNDEVQPVVDRSAYQLCEKYGKNADIFPTEITALVGKRYAFKVSIDEYNAKKLLPVFTVLRLSDDPQIIESIRPMATPTKDLESQTDENTTPVNMGKISHATSGGKRPVEEDRGSKSSNFKKKAIEVKIEKDA